MDPPAHQAQVYRALLHQIYFTYRRMHIALAPPPLIEPTATEPNYTWPQLIEPTVTEPNYTWPPC